MAIAPQPPVLSMAWASNDDADKNTIPPTRAVADMSNSAAASWSMGFPVQTSQSQGQGGYYVARQDMNGALNALSQFALFAQSGAVYTWSPSVDYAAGAHVRDINGVEYIALVDSGPDVSSAVDPKDDVNYTTWQPYMRTIADYIYPVGSVYMSVNSTSPALLFGGTWVQIAGRVLVGTGGGFTAGQTGGNAGGTHKITINELPAHSHVATTADAGEHIHTATNANAGAHTHTVTVNNAGAHTHTTSGTAASAGAHTHNISITNGAQSAGAHTHGVTYTATDISATTASNGAHTHGTPSSKTTITTSNPSPATHYHTRGTMNIVGTFNADQLYDHNFSGESPNYTPIATGAFKAGGATSRRTPNVSADSTQSGFSFDASRSGAWTGHTSSDGTHTHTITINANAMTTANAGAHTHGISFTIPAKNMTTASAGAHTHNLSGTTASAGSHTHTVSGTAASAGTHNHDASTASAGSHTHTITVQTSGVHQHTVTVNNTGGGVAMNIMPPYLVVYMWQRTA